MANDVEYQEWLKEVEGGITDPDEKAAFQRFTGTDTGKKVFHGHLREKDYYNRLNALAGEKRAFAEEKQVLQEEVATWYAEEALKRQAVELENKRLKERPVDTPADPSYARKDEIEGLKGTMKQTFDRLPTILAQMGKITRRAVKEGFDIDETEILKYATNNRVNVEKAYEDLTADARSQRAAKELEDKLAEARAEGERAALSKINPSGTIRPSAATSAAVDHLMSGNISKREDRLKAAKERFMTEFGGKFSI